MPVLDSSPQRTRAEDPGLETEEFRLPHEEDTLANQLDIEIKCPRCGEVMERFSKFDYLSYYCGSCGLELNVN
jgi:ribosomal protein S27AE